MKSVRISLKTARTLLVALPLASLSYEQRRAVAALEFAMTPKRSVVASRKRREAKRQTKKEETAAIREAVMRRANGLCEHCGATATAANPLELDHMFGRVRAKQSERNCWALTRACHHLKTDNLPTAQHWLRSFHQHAARHGFLVEASRALARIDALDALDALELSRGGSR